MSIAALSGKVFLLVTGASRGIGRQIAISFGSKLHEGSHVLLLARDINGLKETAKKLPTNISVDTVSVDLGKAVKDELHAILTQSLAKKGSENFDRIVIVHNVGTMGDLQKTVNDMTDINIWRSYFDINVFMPVILNGVVMKIFDEKKLPYDKRTVINITSLYGIQPGKGTGYYSSGKAAREMIFKVFAKEYPEVNVLNYSPGPVDTDMFHMVCDTIYDEETRKMFNEMRTNSTCLTTEQTVNRLLVLLKDQKYNSGDHIDYFDEL